MLHVPCANEFEQCGIIYACANEFEQCDIIYASFPRYKKFNFFKLDQIIKLFIPWW